MKMPITDADEGLNLTPMIDVVFLLLIFFLVATRFDEEEKLVSINLAEILQAQPIVSGTQEIVVNITKAGAYDVAGQQYNEEQLIAILHEAAVRNPGNQRVQIRADQEVQFRYPLTVIGICKREEMEYSCTVLQQRT
jgi:biopolymer transport protein ExbD